MSSELSSLKLDLFTFKSQEVNTLCRLWYFHSGVSGQAAGEKRQSFIPFYLSSLKYNNQGALPQRCKDTIITYQKISNSYHQYNSKG